jgi:2-oxoglutarate/2-oxoacid ferredoxin oxidoreductase subunit beta
MENQIKIQPTDYNSPVKPTWCPGCGNFSILNALRMALIEQNLSPSDVLLVFDIGCNGNMADKITSYGFKGLHGRGLPIGAGAYIANKNLKIIVFGGDGGTLDEGIHHFIHSIRSNYDITFIMHDNCTFGLTTGQETPTTPIGQPMSATPWGVTAERLNPVQLALVSGATFVANGWTGNIKQMKDLIISAMQHKGLGFVHIFQDCPTYNKFENVDWLKERVSNVEEVENYNSEDRLLAYKIADYINEKRTMGILFQDKSSIPFLEKINYRKDYQTELKDEVQTYNIDKLLTYYK